MATIQMIWNGADHNHVIHVTSTSILRWPCLVLCLHMPICHVTSQLTAMVRGNSQHGRQMTLWQVNVNTDWYVGKLSFTTNRLNFTNWQGLGVDKVGRGVGIGMGFGRFIKPPKVKPTFLIFIIGPATLSSVLFDWFCLFICLFSLFVKQNHF